MLFYYDYATGLPRTPEPQEKDVTCITGERKRIRVPDETTLQERYIRGVRYFEVTLPTVRQVARNQFNCQRLPGAALENQPTNEDCFGSHFEERFFFTEALSAVSHGVPEILSSLTLGLLHDSGWYMPDFSVANVSPFGHGAGCEFVEGPCIVDGEVPSYSSGQFCNRLVHRVKLIMRRREPHNTDLWWIAMYGAQVNTKLSRASSKGSLVAILRTLLSACVIWLTTKR